MASGRPTVRSDAGAGAATAAVGYGGPFGEWWVSFSPPALAGPASALLNRVLAVPP